MPKTDFASVDDYLAAQAPAQRAALRRVRSIIRKAIPQADEVISYQIPAYKVNGRTALFFAAWKEHYSLYPAGDQLVAFRDELARYTVSKGAIRFPLSEPIPANLIARIAKFRATQVAARAKTKRTPSKKRSRPSPK